MYSSKQVLRRRKVEKNRERKLKERLRMRSRRERHGESTMGTRIVEVDVRVVCATSRALSLFSSFVTGRFYFLCDIRLYEDPPIFAVLM